MPFQKTVKYLGVHIDTTLSLEAHISAVCKSCYWEIRKIAHIRKYLTQRAAAMLMSALVLSRLDFCNSLFAGLPKTQIKRLQLVQNHAARVVMKGRRRDHVTPLLRELHWLPVELRCQFKIATLVFRHFDESLPDYLSDCLVSRQCLRVVRSSKDRRLDPPRRKSNYVNVGGRAFSRIAPNIWNSLPADLKSLPSLPTFKARLKTHFFRQYFG